MVIAVEGGSFVRREEEEDADHPVRYLPLGRVYSSTAPCPPLPTSKKPPRAAAAAPAKPPVIVYYRRRRKRPRLQDPTLPSSPATPQEDPEPEGRGSRRKCPPRHELHSLGPTPPALDADADLVRRRQPRRSGGGAESTSAGRQRRPRHGSQQKEAASSTGRRWVE